MSMILSSTSDSQTNILQEADIKPSDITTSLLVKAISFRGILAGSVSQCVSPHVSDCCDCSPVSLIRFEDMNRLISGKKLAPVINKVFEFEEAKEAYKYLQSQKHVGKIVVRVAKDQETHELGNRR